MAAANRNKKRFLEMTQVLLAFIGTCGVVNSTVPHGAHHRPGFAATVPLKASAGDRRLADLARSERKRREAQQLASRRAAGLKIAVARQQANV